MSHVTQEQAKRLKELGYPQGDLNEIGRAVQCNCGLQMMHVDLDTDWTVGIDYTHLAHDWDIDHKWYRAPSAEELMEWLPKLVRRGVLNIAKVTDESTWNWWVSYIDDDHIVFRVCSIRLIDSLYECACWVLEGKK